MEIKVKYVALFTWKCELNLIILRMRKPCIKCSQYVEYVKGNCFVVYTLSIIYVYRFMFFIGNTSGHFYDGFSFIVMQRGRSMKLHKNCIYVDWTFQSWI